MLQKKKYISGKGRQSCPLPIMPALFDSLWCYFQYFNCGVRLWAGGVSQGKFPCLSNVFYSGRTVSSWATSATRGTRPRPGRCTRCSGWGSSSAWTTTPPTCRILWMISMIPTEELIIDTIRNALLFNKFTFVHRVI